MINVGRGRLKRGFTRKRLGTGMGLQRTRINAKRVRSGDKPTQRTPGGIPAWIKAIPVSKKAHGSGHLQKRLWRVTSDFCRIRDWHKFDGRCVATGKKLETWNHGQGGHFKSYTKCNGMYKFHPDNIHLQSPQSNAWPDKDTWKHFEKELEKRYGEQHLRQIEVQNGLTPLKITNEMVLKDIEDKIVLISELPEHPPYFNRVLKLLECGAHSLTIKTRVGTRS